MDLEKLQQYISKDDLKAAIQLLLDDATKRKEAQLLNGRLTSLTQQQNQGTINTNDYNIERNKIRAGVLSLSTQKEPSLGIVKKFNAKRLGLLLIPALLLTLFLFRKQLPFLSGGNTPIENRTKTLTKFTEALSYEVTPMNFSVSKEYRQALGYLKRKFSWKVNDLIVSAQPEDITIQYIQLSQAYLITIQKAKLSASFYIDNKRAATVTNSLWLEPTSKDGAFWQAVNPLTRSKVNASLKKNKRELKNLKASLQKQAINKFKQLNPHLTEATIDVKFGKLMLSDGAQINI